MAALFNIVIVDCLVRMAGIVIKVCVLLVVLVAVLVGQA